jgi:hypothetical protein
MLYRLTGPSSAGAWTQRMVPSDPDPCRSLHHTALTWKPEGLLLLCSPVVRGVT